MRRGECKGEREMRRKRERGGEQRTRRAGGLLEHTSFKRGQTSHPVATPSRPLPCFPSLLLPPSSSGCTFVSHVTGVALSLLLVARPPCMPPGRSHGVAPPHSLSLPRLLSISRRGWASRGPPLVRQQANRGRRPRSTLTATDGDPVSPCRRRRRLRPLVASQGKTAD